MINSNQADILEKGEFFEEIERIFALNSLSLYLNERTKSLFYELTRIILNKNKRMNLTALTATGDIILKHYADSICIEKHIPKGAKVIDIGCGAGFPLFPLAIVREDIRITALDSTAKKIDFVKETASLLELSNIQTLCERAEMAARDPLLREKFDVACARAVARTEVLCEYCIPYLRIGGYFIAMKAKPEQDELDGADRVAKKLYSTIENIEKLTINDGNETYERTLILIKKQFPTPKIFPRNNAQISKKPL